MKIRQSLPIMILGENTARLTPCDFVWKYGKATPYDFWVKIRESLPLMILGENMARLTPWRFWVKLQQAMQCVWSWHMVTVNLYKNSFFLLETTSLNPCDFGEKLQVFLISGQTFYKWVQSLSWNETKPQNMPLVAIFKTALKLIQIFPYISV